MNHEVESPVNELTKSRPGNIGNIKPEYFIGSSMYPFYDRIPLLIINCADMDLNIIRINGYANNLDVYCAP